MWASFVIGGLLCCFQLQCSESYTPPRYAARPSKYPDAVISIPQNSDGAPASFSQMNDNAMDLETQRQTKVVNKTDELPSVSSALNKSLSNTLDQLLSIFGTLERSVNRTEQQLAGITKTVSNLVPVGSIIAFHQDKVVPECWLQCNGAAFSTATYPQLAVVLSPRTITPDLRGKFPIGVTQQAPWSVVGQTGGEAAHALSMREMPRHNHRIANFESPNPRWKVDESGHNQFNLSPESARWGKASYLKDTMLVTEYEGAQKNANKEGPQNGEAHNNLPPFLTVSYIIRAC